MRDRLGALVYQARIWGGTLGSLLWLPKYFSRFGRRRLSVAWSALMTDLPVIDLEVVLGERVAEDVTANVMALGTRASNCTLYEHFAIAAVTRLVRPRVAIEIGTYDGRSALAIAPNIAEGGIVYTLNLPPDYVETHPEQAGIIDVALSAKVRSGERWEGLPEAAKIKQLFGDSRHFDFTPYFPCQLFLIDGAHDTATVLSDSRNALAGIDRQNGAILWDDAQIFGVPPALQTLIDEGYPIRVIVGTELAVLVFKDGEAVAY
jgi:hypothetical protein